jgi:acyl carrier protein
VDGLAASAGPSSGSGLTLFRAAGGRRAGRRIVERSHMDDVRNDVREFILREFLPGEEPANLKDDTPLITGGILDSIATLKLVAFLEERYKIELQAHETDVDHLNTLTDISRLVQAKR